MKVGKWMEVLPWLESWRVNEGWTGPQSLARNES